MTFVVRSAVAVFALLIAGTVNVRAETNMMFILDGSNSMWGRIDGVPKIETARSVLSGLLTDIGADTKVGLMAYGHRNKTSCDDIQVIAPVGADTPKQLIAALNKIQPTGMTPIAGALKAAGRTFANKGDNNNVILISDGIETCNGDPCAVAGELSSAGVKTRVHVIGFDVNEAARKQLKCIADAGHGTYLNAKNAGELKVAVAEVKKVAEAAPEPKEPPKPAVNVVFKDEFDGKDLKPVWQVKNPNPDAYLVEKGHLLMIAHAKGGFDNAQTPNLMTLNQKMPDGDWEMKTIVQADYQTATEGVWMGLYGDEKNFVAARLYTSGNNLFGWGFSVEIIKSTNGQITKFTKSVRNWGCNVCGADRMFPQFAKGFVKPVTLSLVKRGRKFFARAVLEGDKDKNGKQIVHETEAISSLRAPGGPTLAVAQNKDTKGETLFYFDKLEIDAIE